eukprot:TRINITY_DN9859_c0_g3_i2.p1 TRINITY_DN9859_c0_g3~~TRINITY_DN9859_c0_g3_i2.p1  ORF type:complete len:776 (+),score=230.95 TRINITY_DN9859_c0_g3_i2:137-2464(+)
MELTCKIKAVALTTEMKALLLFFIQVTVSFMQFVTLLPLMQVFDLVLICIGLDFAFTSPLRSFAELYGRHKKFLIRVNALCFLIVFLYGGFEFFQTTLMILLIIPKLESGSDLLQSGEIQSKQKDFADVQEHIPMNGIPNGISEFKLRRKRLLSEALNDDKKWLDLLDEGYFVCNSTLQLVYYNKRAEQIMAELKADFETLIKCLAEPQNPSRSLEAILSKFVAEGIDGTSAKVEFSVFSGSKGDRLERGFVGELLCNYKTQLWKLSDERMLIKMRRKDSFSTQILAKKLDNAITSTLSHELKTILNAVMGSISLLEDTIDKEHMIYYRSAAASSHIFSSKLSDLFDYIQIQDKGFALHPAEFRPEKLVKEVADVYLPAARQKQLVLATEVEKAVPLMIKGDTARIKQILFNLMTKAIDYTDYGRVVLRVKVNKQRLVEFQVRSFGCGMHNALLAGLRNFSPTEKKNRFRKAGSRTKVTENMEEMYLEIAQLIAREMGTKIIVKTLEKKVSQFHFALPETALKVDRKTVKRNSLYFKEGKLRIFDRFKDIELNNNHESISARKRKENLLDLPLQPVNDDCSDFDVPGEYGGNAILISRKYTFYTKSPPAFNRKRNYSVTASPTETHKQMYNRSSPVQESKERLLGSPPRVVQRRREKRRRGTSQDYSDSLQVRNFGRKCIEDTTSCSILIADDNMSNRFVIRSLLKKCGYNSIEAHNGSDAVSIISKCIKDGTLKHLRLIFMDLQMPIMDGIESTRAIIETVSYTHLTLPTICSV